MGYSEKDGLCSSTNTNFWAVKCFRIIRFVFSVSARGDELIVGISQQLTVHLIWWRISRTGDAFFSHWCFYFRRRPPPHSPHHLSDHSRVPTTAPEATHHTKLLEFQSKFSLVEIFVLAWLAARVLFFHWILYCNSFSLRCVFCAVPVWFLSALFCVLWKRTASIHSPPLEENSWTG